MVRPMTPRTIGVVGKPASARRILAPGLVPPTPLGAKDLATIAAACVTAAAMPTTAAVVRVSGNRLTIAPAITSTTCIAPRR